jgi:hypothetical protein
MAPGGKRYLQEILSLSGANRASLVSSGKQGLVKR